MYKVYENYAPFTAFDANSILRQTVIPIASQTERATITDPYHGMIIYRTDLGYCEIYRTAYNAATNKGGALTAGWYPATGASITRRRAAAYTCQNARTIMDWDTPVRDRGAAFLYAAGGVFTCKLPGTVTVAARLVAQGAANMSWLNIALKKMSGATATIPRIGYAMITTGGWATGGVDADVDVLPGDKLSVEFWSGVTVPGTPTADGADAATAIEIRYL